MGRFYDPTHAVVNTVNAIRLLARGNFNPTGPPKNEILNLRDFRQGWVWFAHFRRLTQTAEKEIKKIISTDKDASSSNSSSSSSRSRDRLDRFSAILNEFAMHRAVFQRTTHLRWRPQNLVGEYWCEKGWVALSSRYQRFLMDALEAEGDLSQAEREALGSKNRLVDGEAAAGNSVERRTRGPSSLFKRALLKIGGSDVIFTLSSRPNMANADVNEQNAQIILANMLNSAYEGDKVKLELDHWQLVGVPEDHKVRWKKTKKTVLRIFIILHEDDFLRIAKKKYLKGKSYPPLNIIPDFRRLS